MTLLLETMRRYASSAADSRELVDELEFVWDQVKTNVSPGSSGSSPIHNSHILPITASNPTAPLSSSPPTGSGPPPARRPTPTSSPAPFSFVAPPAVAAAAAAARLRNPKRASAPARTVSPSDLRALASSPALSTSDGYGAGDDLDPEDDDADGAGDEFVDAPDGSEAPATGLAASRMLFSSDEEGDGGGARPLPGPVARALDPRGARPAANPSSAVAAAVGRDDQAKPGAEADGAEDGPAAAAARADEKFARWRRRVSAALIKLTAEVAALREQLAASASSPYSRLSPVRAAWRTAAFLAKVLAVDAVLLLALMAWMRWWGRGGRVEGAFRVLVGDAVAQAVRRAGAGVERSVVRVGRAVMGQGRREGGS